ncbi:MAG: EamA family transporter RarD [Alicyclobacillus sp.]|nr:EamA family transporter RarD [Alicyclobacillus sp.]
MSSKKGVLYAILAYGGWGLLPVYWKAFASISAFEVLAHRIVWSVLFVWLLVLVSRRWPACRGVFRDKRRMAWTAVGGAFITINWLTYIYAVNSGHIVEASLGYYINPLVNVLLGVALLRERLSRLQWFAMALAAVGVGVMVASYGKFPWIALLLAASFGLYGLVKKKASADAIVSLTWETTTVVPIALAYLVFLQAHGTAGAFSLPVPRLILLLLSGVATAIPLLWFAMAAKGLDLATLGVIQYLSPTISLVLGIFLYHEAFTGMDLLSFSCIWAALLVYTAAMIHHQRSVRPPRPTISTIGGESTSG